MIILYIFLGVLAVYSLYFVAQFYNIIIHGYPPFISSSFENISKIIQESEIHEGQNVYELGCGRARFLRMIEKSHQKIRLVGVENLFSVYFINWLRLKLQGSKIKLINEDIFNIDLRVADVIYCYLNNTTMLKLGPKIIKECRPGTEIICQAFSVSQLEPRKVIIVNGKKVYYYTV